MFPFTKKGRQNMAQNSPGQSRGGASAALENYVPVAERIEKFYERFPEGKILTQVVEHNREDGFVLVRAEIYRLPEDASPAATGHAYEYKDAGYVQKGSYIEVAETSAVGRALAFLNFETKRGIASCEEMEKFARSERAATAAASGTSSSAGRTAGGEATARDAAPPTRSATPASPTTDEPRKRADDALTTAAPAAATPTVALATDDQKEEILILLEEIYPNDRRAQKRALTDATNKQSREDLTQTEARRFLAELKKRAIP